MTTTGKHLRLGRFRLPCSRYGIIVPIDHGLTIGPIDGIENTARIASWIDHGSVSGIIAHKGMIERLVAHRRFNPSIGVMMHLTGMSAMAPDPDRKMRLTCMETAVRYGADAVSLQVNFDGENDAHNLELIGNIVDHAQPYGLPVLAMVYDTVAKPRKERIARQRHLMRIAVELGVDAIKIAPPDEIADVPEVLENIAEDVAVFCAGGTMRSDDALLALARQVALHGAAGLCIGRNVFQRQSPGEMLDRIRAEFAAVEAASRHGLPERQVPAMANPAPSPSASSSPYTPASFEAGAGVVGS